LSQSYKHYYSKYFIDVKRSKCLRIIIISFDLLSFQSFFDEINKNLFLIIKKAMHCLVSKRSASFHLPFFGDRAAVWLCIELYDNGQFEFKLSTPNMKLGGKINKWGYLYILFYFLFRYFNQCY
jgi:hypothetical protein